MTYQTKIQITSSDLNKWLSIKEVIAKYPQFSHSMIKRLAWKRHENNFIHCCRVVGRRTYIHEELFAEWFQLLSDQSPKMC